VYNPPRPTEVYTLSDQANAAIPEDIREQFHRDDRGHVLFFASPPLAVPKVAVNGKQLQHSARYLAARARRSKERDLKRQREEEANAEREEARKKMKKEEDLKLAQQVEESTAKAFSIWVEETIAGTNELYKKMFGEQWENAKKLDEQATAKTQEQQQQRIKEREKWEREKEEREKVSLKPPMVYLDDIDPRF
jgi:chromatin structure-remodeling complex subunit RSC1/2